MAKLHSGATLTPSKVELLPSWVAKQRWYAAKDRLPDLDRIAAWRLDDPAGEVGIETLLVLDRGAPTPVVYQIPLTYRAAPLPGGAAALVGTIEHSVLGTRWVYDAPHDPVYAANLLALAQGLVPAASSSDSDALEERVTGAAMSSATLTWRSSRVLAGEQSNTSIIMMATDEAGGERPVIAKVFRTLANGENPDVILQGALAAAGSLRVPASLGAVRGSWSAPGETDTASGHLAFVQEFLPGAQDAWREALLWAASGRDFGVRARALGEATAEVHSLLKQSLPTEAVSPDAIADTLTSMRSRLAQAIAAAPSLADREPAIEATFVEAAASTWPDFQRIHGDFHLGQVLDVPGRGWVLLDFEGEPMRPLSERVRPDQPLRDIAGMLRSFDYVGGSVEQGTRGVSARGWVDGARRAFLDGYAAHSGSDPRDHTALLAAYELDKALYEVVYEASNRPTWVTIPIAAIDRLLPATGSAKEESP